MNESSIHKSKEFTFDKDYFVVAVSDVHLGFDFFSEWFPAPAEAFGKFIKQLKCSNTKIDNFVILGDFFDLWRRDDDKLFRKPEVLEILNNLVEMKTEPEGIDELHYLVGNHDFNILLYKWYDQYLGIFSRHRRGWLKYFEVKSGSSCMVKSLKLSPPNIVKSFVFRHGHQDKVGKIGGLISDPLCALLCAMGNETGRLASIIWRYKSYIPIIVTAGVYSVLTILTATSSQWLFTGIFGAFAFVSFLVMFWVMTTPRYKAMRALRDDVKQLMKLKGEERKRRMDLIVRKVLMSMDEESGVEEVAEVVRVGEEPIVPYKMLQELIKKTKPVKPLGVAIHGDILIVGHTHKLVEEENIKYNPGAWVEDKGCRILTIDCSGNVEMHKWPPYEATLP